MNSILLRGRLLSFRREPEGLDDSGAYGIGIATAFEAQAKKRGIEVLGHDRLDPKASDYAGDYQDQGARRTVDLLRR